MTISSTARRAGPFLGNDSATAFAFTFKVFSTSDITVTTADSAAVETTLALDTDYTVTLNPNQDTSPGGVVTYPISGSALPTGSRLTIIGNLPYDQPLDIPAGGNFNPVTIENEFDRIVMQVQQLREVADRSITASVTSSVSGELPVPQAGRLLGWDQSNTAIVNYSIEELTGTAAYATWVYDTFSGTGIRRIFTLQRSPGNIANCDVSVDGQTLVPITDFTVSGSTLTFVTAPRSGAEILVRYGSAAPQGTYAIETERKIATAGQTVVTLTELTYVPGANNISVYLNGARMSAGIDFTETSSTSITFESALSLNDEIVCVVGNEVAQAVGSQNVGFLQSGTGAVSRSVQSRLRDTVSVKDFGAVGDGVTDDATNFTTALAARQYIVVPKGEYKLNTPVTINTGYKVQFDYGAVWTGTGFTGSGQLTDYSTSGIGVERRYNQQAAYIQGFSIDADVLNKLDVCNFRVTSKDGRNALVGATVNDSAASDGTFPTGVSGYAKLNRNGNTVFGLFGIAEQYSYGVATNEVNTFNYKSGPPGVFPPNRAFGISNSVPITLTVAAGGTYQSLIGVQVCREGSVPNSYICGYYSNPDAVTNFGIFVDADSSSGPVISGTFKTPGTSADSYASALILQITNSSPVSTARFLRCLNSGGTQLMSIKTDGKLSFDSSSLYQSTVGVAGAASVLPSNPTGYLKIEIAGLTKIIPYYEP